MTIQIKVDQYLHSRPLNTRRAYLSNWLSFVQHIGGEDCIEHSTPSHASDWLHAQRFRPGQEDRATGSRRASEKTLARKYWACRTIFARLLEQGVVPSNPFAALPRPEPAEEFKRPTGMIDFAAVKRIVAAPGAHTVEAVRDTALLSVMFGAGLRRSEARELLLCDIRAIDGETRLEIRHTKGKKCRSHPIPKWAATALWNLIESRKAEGAKLHEFIFMAYFGEDLEPRNQLSESSFYRIFKMYCRRAGYPDASPHWSRATAITRLHTMGYDTKELKEFSGHASEKSVEGYVKKYESVKRNPGRALNYD